MEFQAITLRDCIRYKHDYRQKIPEQILPPKNEEGTPQVITSVPIFFCFDNFTFSEKSKMLLIPPSFLSPPALPPSFTTSRGGTSNNFWGGLQFFTTYTYELYEFAKRIK